MLPDWDKHQDLRKPASTDISQAVADAADRITAARVVHQMVRERKMSLLGKMQHLTASAEEFNKKTETVLDGIADKIKAAEVKRDQAAIKHHGYYDDIIKGVDDSVVVIDRLSNGPL